MPLLPAGQERISSAAPDPGGSAAPLGTDTNSSRPSCPASYLGNQTQPSDVTGPLRSNQHRLSLLLSPPPSLRSPSPGRRRGGAVMPPPGHSVLAAPRPPCGALCPALELRPGAAPPRSGRAQSQGRKWRLLALGLSARAPSWPKCGLEPAFLSQREAFVHRHPPPSECPDGPHPRLLLWWQFRTCSSLPVQEVCCAWPPALEVETATLLAPLCSSPPCPPLSCDFPWRLCCDIHLLWGASCGPGSGREGPACCLPEFLVRVLFLGFSIHCPSLLHTTDDYNMLNPKAQAGRHRPGPHSGATSNLPSCPAMPCFGLPKFGLV